MKDLIQMATVGAVIAFAALFIVGPYRVEGDSMEPSYTDGQFLLIDKISLRWRGPRPGEVVVFKLAGRGDLIKRVVRQVGPDQYWVEGDNADHSSDSRQFGPIDKQLLLGRVMW